jgi:hypothetical protein
MITNSNNAQPAGHRRRSAVRRISLGLAIACGAVAAAGSNHVSADEPPPWSHCKFADHPPAADLGPLLPAQSQPPAEVVAVLVGDVAVGTDCSVYDRPV